MPELKIFRDLPELNDRDTHTVITYAVGEVIASVAEGKFDAVEVPRDLWWRAALKMGLRMRGITIVEPEDQPGEATSDLSETILNHYKPKGDELEGTPETGDSTLDEAVLAEALGESEEDDTPIIDHLRESIEAVVDHANELDAFIEYEILSRNDAERLHYLIRSRSLLWDRCRQLLHDMTNDKIAGWANRLDEAHRNGITGDLEVIAEMREAAK